MGCQGLVPERLLASRGSEGYALCGSAEDVTPRFDAEDGEVASNVPAVRLRGPSLTPQDLRTLFLCCVRTSEGCDEDLVLEAPFEAASNKNLFNDPKEWEGQSSQIDGAFPQCYL